MNYWITRGLERVSATGEFDGGVSGDENAAAELVGLVFLALIPAGSRFSDKP